MALSWPSVPAPMHFSIQPREQVVGDASPYTGSREIFHRWHQWHVIMQWNHLTNSNALQLMAFLSRGRGGLTLYKVPLYHYRAKRGTKTGTVTLSGGHDAGATNLTITGGSGLLLQGDWIYLNQATDVPRAYQVVSSESAGIIIVNPGLRIIHSHGTTVHHFDGGPILDTMELPPDPTFSSAMPSPLPGTFQPFMVEFVSALRANP